jgi:glutathione S-transferase
MLLLATTEREYPWGTLRSTNASKVKVVLEEKAIPYQLDRLRPGNLWKKPPEILAKHPLGKVPYLETDEDGVIFDSTVINEYLDDKYPDHPLKPVEPAVRARMRMFENFADEGIMGVDLPKIWMPMWSPPEDRNQDAMQNGRDGLKVRALPYIEKEIASREYLCDEFTLADVPYMAIAMVLEVDEYDLGDFPNCQAYFDRLRSRPSYHAISAKTSLEDSAGRT